MISDIINMFIGLSLTFAMAGLLVSAATEGLSSLFSLRSSNLLAGVKTLLADPGFTGLARKVMTHAAINPHAIAIADTDTTTVPSMPAYVPAEHFALALVDALQGSGQAGDDLETAIGKVENPALRKMLETMLTRAEGDLDRFRQSVATWFDCSMERVSGLYKRRIQLISFLLALALAAAMNIDAFKVARASWENPNLTASLDLPATVTTVTADGNRETAVQTDLSAFKTLQKMKAESFPFGWSRERVEEFKGWGGVMMVCGWLVTAVATLFGAPFWFDSLQRFVRLRSTGLVPALATAGKEGSKESSREGTRETGEETATGGVAAAGSSSRD